MLSRFGDVSGFELRDVPVPELQPGCALVQIAATSVNPVDYKLRQHGSAMAPDLPAILGAASGKTDISLLSATARLNGQIVAIAGRGHRDLEPLFGRGQSLHFVLVLIPMLYGFGRAAHGAILERIATLVDAGTVRPLVDPIRFRLREAADAHRFAESGRALGKVII
ncbi:MAG: Alcohol dehydrogenase zinc-binding domain protein [Gammaproteobacteria bacterium]|nr:Alcohol dehydrogenase zinc-binding domain protein [Gammaproteobacteria bacterium]